tara:strand:+ start:336863 stop:337552 length:690 start_codon:yes stop_codon:yes gene_type:complete
MSKSIVLFFLIFPLLQFSQTVNDSNDIDTHYLEDQFYLGLNYNFMLNRPDGVVQRNFSYGLQGGIIRDLPLNVNRNFGLGIGIGYAVNSYYTNLISTADNGTVSYSVASSDFKFDRSKFEIHSIELPFELRWRNSTPTDYKFLRIYSGIKFGYNFSARSKLVTSDTRNGFANPDIEKFQYGLTFNLGYNTFNLHLYYSLSDFLKKDTVLDTGETIAMKPIRIGLIFYIL